ncbi:hypothetical protein Sxan_34580 [Streptomyces xanthophaeus]|uniref:Uncharacterized protein n=1 Tax=Streptomyces xanthophaeus TaxID=67385 RepID=A0A919H293_9ACTN|nr:hypothetical protein Sxan_34580 [Streptomyces xanthophaeus]
MGCTDQAARTGPATGPGRRPRRAAASGDGPGTRQLRPETGPRRTAAAASGEGAGDGPGRWRPCPGTGPTAAAAATGDRAGGGLGQEAVGTASERERVWMRSGAPGRA